MNPEKKLSLVVPCTGEACAAKPEFKWTLIERNDSVTKVLSLNSLLSSNAMDKDLTMKADSLQQGTNYTLRLRGTGVGGAYYEQEYSFTTNIAPKNGKYLNL